MNLSLILFLIGILGFVLNRKNIILMIISIEIMLLSITFLILIGSIGHDDIIGQIYSIYIIALAGAESAIGLSILVAFYRFIPLHYKCCYLIIFTYFHIWVIIYIDSLLIVMY
uniref:NADH-ubiquinone oxidoreductase chain 4L n=2 Tax=Paracoccidioides TaxID=38946 RepID=Q1XA90_PARBD|nr:NADH dehydrogenase subunit 4L [Paracoccidioides brasiliensis]AAY30331.1 NADH dehydrogenase subunit 4L [Paracoccidioides brasiliensis]QNS38572.1 NADH dehydrogenase subunit 4L [Paracoccidioides sp. 'americana']